MEESVQETHHAVTHTNSLFGVGFRRNFRVAVGLRLASSRRRCQACRPGVYLDDCRHPTPGCELPAPDCGLKLPDSDSFQAQNSPTDRTDPFISVSLLFCLWYGKKGMWSVMRLSLLEILSSPEIPMR